MIDDRVDSGPRDLRRFDEIRRSRYVHLTCKGKTPRDFSPTRRKKKRRARLNIGTRYRICVTAPNYLPGPTIPVGPLFATPSPRGAPHGRMRGPCHASAPPAPRVGHSGVAAWPKTSSRRLGPLATSAPAGKHPLFANFLIENSIYKSSKNRKKWIKLQKFII